MSINNDAFATKFTGELDKIITEKSSVGFMTDNAFKAKFVGAKTVKIPSISMQGLGDYDRETGFIKGAVNVSNTAYTMQQDRARTFTIDREDMDETGIASLAGSVMSEFVRTKVVPETDAYVLSKLGSLAATRGQLITLFDTEKPYEMFNKLLDNVQSQVGLDEELVCFVDRYIWTRLRKSDEFSKVIELGHFRQGELKFEVNKIDNVTIIPVSNSRMMTSFEFLSGKDGGEAGGYKPTENSRGIYMIMLPKSAASLVKKSEKIRIFTPDQNLDADAYKFDYRLYYDVFVKNSYASSVWAALAPSVEIVEHYESVLELTQEELENETTIGFAFTPSEQVPVDIQWYSCDDADGNNPVRILNAQSQYLDYIMLKTGVNYVYATITVGGATVRKTSICTVTVSEY